MIVTESKKASLDRFESEPMPLPFCRAQLLEYRLELTLRLHLLPVRPDVPVHLRECGRLPQPRVPARERGRRRLSVWIEERWPSEEAVRSREESHGDSWRDATEGACGNCTNY